MPRHFLTEQIVHNLTCPPTREHFEVFDAQLRGLYVDALKSGRLMYRVRYRERNRYRVVTLGDARLLTLDEARQQARTVQRCVMQGGDPKLAMVQSWHEDMALSDFREGNFFQ